MARRLKLPRLRTLVASLGLSLALLAPFLSASSDASPELDTGAHPRDAARAELKKEEKQEQQRQAKEKAAEQTKEKALEQAKAKEKALEQAKARAILRAKAVQKLKGKKGANEPAKELSSFPLLITYDPSVIGIGGPCPGDNEISRGECALVVRDLRSARSHFLDAWNTARSPFAAMRLGDLAWMEGEQETALQWYEQVNGSTMMQRMANLRRCELETGCGVTGRTVPAAETFSGPFGDEALLRTARIYTRSGFPELAASILVDGDGRGCDLAIETCEQIASAALEKRTTTSTLALSLSTRRSGDGHDEARSVAARQLGLDALAEDLDVTARGDVPAHRVTLKEEAAAEAKVAREARRAAARAEAEAKKAAEAAEKEAAEKEAAKAGDKKDAKEGEPKDEAAKEAAAKEAAAKEAAAKEGAPASEPGKDTVKDTPKDKAAQKKAERQKALDKRMKRDAIDRGVKGADDSLEKARRLLEVAGGGLPLGGPK